MNEIKSKILDSLTLAGFTAFTPATIMNSNLNRKKYGAVVALKSIKSAEEGYSLLSENSESQILETLSVRLLGKSGDCSDFDAFHDKILAFCESMFLTTGIRLRSASVGDIHINGVLSRLECELALEYCCKLVKEVL